jgi:CDP-4-dehydro-6-deoxyglucose reductase/3-phenylpropionate/trans-cinnamate dioxygenase ferredoxin reductase subunit
VEIAPTRIIKREPSPRKTLLATVYRISRPASDVVVLRLRFPIGVRAKFRAGQYLKVLMDGNQSRNYSIANPPHESDGVELHIRRVPDGLFSDVVLAGLKKGGTVRVELPYGEFSLSETSMKPAILVATGTGLAPMQSMIEDQLRRGGGRSIHLYWGARRLQDLYLAQLPAQWRRASWLAFTPVVSEPDEEWTGRTGLVHRAVLDDHPDLREFEVYACGNPKMIASARRDFTVEGRLRLEEFYCDVFVASGDVAPLIASVL